MRIILPIAILLFSRVTNGDANDVVTLSPQGVDLENSLPLVNRDLTLLDHAVGPIEDPTCRDQAQLVLEALRNLTSWAVKFYDSTGKFPEGVLSGSIYQLGNFDECLSIGENDEAPVGIRGQYCLGELGVQVPEADTEKQGFLWEHFKKTTDRNEESIDKLYWGLCVPASCRSKDVEDVVKRVVAVAFAGSRVNLTPNVSDRSCYKHEPTSASTSDIIYMCVILSIASVVLGGTIFHAACLRKESGMPTGLLPELIVSFSLIANIKKLFGPAHNDELHIDCISGIKFVAMFFIISGHALIFIISGPILNKNYWEQAITKVENSVFLNNPLLVDTFLLLSGFLFARMLLRELDKRKSVNFLLLYLFRYIRLTPAYLVVVGLYVTWLPKLDNGPLWFRMETEKDRCLNSWWANILYINNYVNTDNLCMFQSWYLSVDTQLFILAPVVIYPLWKWRKFGEILLVAVTSLSIITPFVITLKDNLDPTLMIYKSEIQDISTNEFFKNTYMKTHMRAEAYCFGLICGYLVYRLQTSDYKLSKKTVRLGWLLGSLSLILSMCSITLFYGPRQQFLPIEAAVYSALHRAFWSIGTSWVLVACITDNSGPIRNFLKWRPFVPLSRLTYSAYLINGLIELHSSSTVRSPRYLDTYNLAGIVLSHVLLTFMGATLLSTMFESPILCLERILLRYDKQKNITSKNHKEESPAPENDFVE